VQNGCGFRLCLDGLVTSPQPAYGDYQLEIYLAGPSGVLPSFPMEFAELEARAEPARPVCAPVRPDAAVSAADGADRRDRPVRPGRPRDLATADAAARTGVPMIASTLSVDPMEEVAARFGETPGFFQLYTPTDRDLAASLVSRAEAAGLFGNPLTWGDLPWLRSLTTLPLLVKGICHPDDVRRARDGGVDGIYCSTHGGRQADGGLPALDPAGSRPRPGRPGGPGTAGASPRAGRR
jgi:lactate 2-monooxygenase